MVAFARILDAIAFSGIAGVDPRVGLFGAFLLSVTLAVVGGRTAMITSATGSTALLMTDLVQQGDALGEGMGLQLLLAAGLLTGVLQIAWGYLRLAQQMRFVPQPVMAGFVDALAILIVLAQLPQLGLDVFHPEKVTVTAAQLPAVWGLVVLTLSIIYLLPRLTTAVPSALMAILISTGLSIRLGLDIPTVASLGTLPGGLPRFAVPQVPWALGTLGLILPTALAISLVGLMETFLTQDILDDLTDSSSAKNAEARGQGIGNIVSSLCGMAGCALVGQSVMNVGYGGRTRLSTLSAGVALLAGVALAAILFSRKVAKVIEVSSELLAPDHRLYRVRGQLFFVSSIYFRQGFEPHEHPHPARVTIDMGDAHIWDQSGVSTLDQVIRRLKLDGSRVEVVHLNPESTDLFARIGVAAKAGGSGRSTASAH